MPLISEELIDNLVNHGVVVYPTTTLPGLGCLPNKTALDNLFQLKQRPKKKKNCSQKNILFQQED